MERAVLVVEIVPRLRIMAWLVLHRRRAFRASLIAGTCGVPGFPGLGCPKAYTLDLRQFTGWCRARSLPLFSVRRAGIETFARELEARGRARATVTRRLRTITGSAWPPLER